MAGAITPPFLLAGCVLVIAGVAKLRSPQVAGEAARTLGLPAGTMMVRTFAGGEVAFGLLCLVSPHRGAPSASTSSSPVLARPADVSWPPSITSCGAW